MRAQYTIRKELFAAMLCAATICLAISRADDPTATNASTVPPARRAQPKPLSINVRNALAYLIDQQHDDGGWGQGGGWRTGGPGSGRVEGPNVQDPSDLGNTCIATLALLRAGNTPQEGQYAKNVARAAKYIYQHVERSPADTLYVTDVRGTQLQSKIGQYVDTFLAGLVLSELKGKMPNDGSDKHLVQALEKTVKKIETYQQADGTFAGNNGWASVLSQGLASKFINRAAQNQVAVRNEVLERDFRGSVALMDRKTGEFHSGGRGGLSASAPVASITALPAGGRETAATAMSDAGVTLYFAGSNASRISDQLLTSEVDAKKANETLVSKTASADEKTRAKDVLKRVDEVREAQRAAVGGIVRQIEDKNFIAGFGNNGGEEFLSYMNIGEMLVVQGGAEWERWDKSITDNLTRVQNGDGSWSGQHCITGRTFCTSAALLTLMADRAPMPLAAALKANK